MASSPRTRAARSVLLALSSCLAAAAPLHAAPDPITGDQATRIVQKYRGTWNSVPTNTATDETPDAPVLGNGDVGVVIAGPASALTFEIGKNEFWSLAEGRLKGMARLNVAIPSMAGASYGMTQELSTAEANGLFNLSGNTLATTSWVQATDTTTNMLVTRMTATGGASRAVTLSYAAGTANTFPSSSGSSGDVLYFDVRADASDQVGGVATRRVRLATRLVGATGTVSGGKLTFNLVPGSTVYVATSVVSLNDDPDFQAAALRNVATRTTADLDALEASHKAWWTTFYKNSFVEIANKTIEKEWYASLYVLASAARADEAAPGLWGPWNATNPAWNGDYTLNYNYETPFYMALATNHVDLAKPYDKPVLDWLPNAQAAAAAHGWTGAYYRVHIGPLPNGSSDTNEWNQKLNGAYAASNMVLRYLTLRNTTYAKGEVYKLVKQVAAFWQDNLVFDGTRYVITDDAQHEGDPSPQTNGVMSLGLVRLLFQGAIAMSTDLQQDAGKRAKWQDILDHLSAYPTLQRNGQTIFRDTEVGRDWDDTNTFAIQHIYPAGQLGLDSDPALLQIARNTVDQMARWRDGNGTNSFYPAAARVGYDPATILSQLNDFIASQAFPNLQIRTNGGGMENVNTVPATLSEMFMQSHQDRIRLFPNWPAGQDAKFGDLRAYGGFLVSSGLQAGAVQYVRFIGERGRTLSFLNPWPGKSLALYRDGVAAGTLSGTTIDLATAAHETLHVAPAGTSYDSILQMMKAPGPGNGSGILAGATATADATCNANEGPQNAIDGLLADKWCSNAHTGAQWLDVDLGTSKTVSRWVVRNAQAGGEPASLNTRDYKLQRSADNAQWVDVDAVTGNTAASTDRNVTSFNARFVRLYVTTPTQTSDGAARIYELELY